MKTILFLLMGLFFCCGCSKGKYYTSDVFRRGDTGKMKEEPLDSTYHFYLREVYKDKNDQNENILKTNVDKNNTGNKIRIEVEYLLLSWAYKRVIYISTNPDKYQHYYSSNRFGDTVLNAYDFSTFHFGKIDDGGESISFVSNDRKKLVTWDIRPFINLNFPQKVFIREISILRKETVQNVILINKALEEPVGFIHQKNFTIIFEKPGSKKDTCDDTGLCRLYDSKVYYRKQKHGTDIFFRFNKNINNSRDSAIGFDYQRTQYPPAF